MVRLSVMAYPCVCPRVRPRRFVFETNKLSEGAAFNNIGLQARARARETPLVHAENSFFSCAARSFGF